MGWIDLVQVKIHLWAYVNNLKNIFDSIRGIGFMFCGELCGLG
jgi:hypothetical protein